MMRQSSVRLLAPLLLALLFLQGIEETRSSSSEEDDSLEKCCGLGSSWAEQRLRCERFTGPVPGIEPDEEPACLEAVDICCKHVFREQACERAKIDAKAGRACDPGDEHGQACCEGCKLGILTGSSGKSCKRSKKFSLGIPWDPAFAECCNEARSTTQDSSSSISTSTITSSSSSTDASTPESEEFDFEEETDSSFPATFKSDDLCQLMKGLLCSEICIPTPGSYYCKCQEGSILQADGRTCKSNTTTTEAVPTKTTSSLSSTITSASSKLTTSPLTKKSVATTIKKLTSSISPASTFKALLTVGAKSRTTRSLSTEDNELNQACPAGYRFTPSTESCDDVDECREQNLTTGTPICRLGTSCLNTNGSYRCIETGVALLQEQRCELGYRWNSSLGRCSDVDECLENIHKCLVETENCRNLEGSYECEIKCENGFVFNGNYGACLDVNECNELMNICPHPDTICVNTLGSYECKNIREYRQYSDSSHARNGTDDRRPGDYGAADDGGRELLCAFGLTYNSDLKRCEDIDECLVHRQPCAPGEICRNTVGGYDCIPSSAATGCPRGFVQAITGSDYTACQDVDECELGLHTCAPHERCQNTNGSFTCETPRPTRRPSTTESPRILCRKGYKASNETGGCVDVDECVEGPGCRDFERCRNLQGSYDCSPLCGPGWYFQLQTKTCQDVDECLLGRHNCRQRTQYCRNTNGSFVCEPLTACSSGYRRSPHNGSCVDIDECADSLHTCSRDSHRYCVNREGGYECITRLPSCSRGYEYSLLTRKCEDVDECRSGRVTCDARFNERCVNLPGSYRCERPGPDPRTQRHRPACPTGYSYDPALRRCSDIDECTEGSHNCGAQKCYNLPGSFQCARAPLPVIRRKTSTTPKAIVPTYSSDRCSIGSRHDSVRGGCVDVDECAELEDACSSNEECVNTPGSFSCECLLGFRRDELTRACVDVNECQFQNDCLPSQRCDNTIGSYICVRFLPCGTGYTLNAATEICEDDDECTLGTHDCSNGYHCRNTLGSYRCDRDRGKTTTTTHRPTTRRTIRPTIRTTIAAYTTTPRTTSTSTTTTPRPTTTTTTTPRPTTTTTLRPTTTTTPRPTTTTTRRPITTTTRRPTTTSTPRTTTTIRSTTPRIIPTFAPRTTTSTEAIPTVGTLITTTQRPYTTIAIRSRVNCPRGFESGPVGQCIDIDECHRNLKMCGLQRCINTIGSFRCEPRVVCSVGFTPDPITGECTDINECTHGTHKCGPDQKCENRHGGYVCYCPPGYEIGSKHNCVDIDECERVKPGHICGSHSQCINSPGSYRCICDAGFEIDPTSGVCRDVDECRVGPGLCQQECYNTWGGHRCGCHHGYRLKSDNRTCEDVDECTEFWDNKLCIGICDNTPGSYACRCPDGYKLAEDGRTCQDIDECVSGNICGYGELCQNVRGGYRCNRINCPSGYIIDSQRKNRCVRESQFCRAHDQDCFQRPAHYTFNYIAIVSMYPIPTSTGQVELFTMRGTYTLPGSTVTFSIAFIQARAPPNVTPATESCFALRRPFPEQAVLVMTRSLQGPQDIELEFSMEIYGPTGTFAGSAVAKIFIIVTQYEF